MCGNKRILISEFNSIIDGGFKFEVRNSCAYLDSTTTPDLNNYGALVII